MTEVHDSPPPPVPPPVTDPADRPPLRRSRRDKVLAGVCGGLGRYFDLDPVIFRIVLGVLAVTGGVGLIFYGFAWLLLPQEGEEDSEAKKLLTGRVEGATLAAVFAALVGCALFLTMADNGAMAVFSVLVILGLAGASYWSQRRRHTYAPEADAPEAQGSAARGAQRPAHRPPPPETQAPPAPGGPSWWRDPLVKDGTTGPVGSTGYLWGPAEAVGDTGGAAGGPGGPGPAAAPPRAAAVSAPRGGIGGRIFVLAMVAAIVGTSAEWQTGPLGHALQVGFAAALAVIGLGLAVSSLTGRTGFGTVLLGLLTAVLLAGATVLPKEVGTDWRRVEWRPAAVADVKPAYTAGTGLATLDLSRLDVPKGTTLVVGASLDAGRLKVIVPREVTAKADIRLTWGDVRLPGEPGGSIRIQHPAARTATVPPAPGTEAGGTIELHLETGVGQVEVARGAS
ncbi:PspC domain-containing protein [Streptomyces sp. NBC_00536]|uniref:PspC domain-containing protein n=1 Tax=Streptomyces sp. NBC_00536 TaxID=2975769 RepID=UPI002E81E1F1|nr:PspC domain-containing protein [Streptomyces sp. NBC_00536]WUC80757.1 PspC domain-containing protein [Streptomyces sp. NBC_00536]